MKTIVAERYTMTVTCTSQTVLRRYWMMLPLNSAEKGYFHRGACQGGGGIMVVVAVVVV